MSQSPHPFVFLLDVDNTLLDNDRVTTDLRHHLRHQVGASCEETYWQIFEELRRELGYADYLGALQRYRLRDPGDLRALEISRFLLHYPFADRLFPGALDAVAHLGRFGPTVVLTDGDVVFQPHKVERSGIWQAVAGRVLLYVHKEHHLADVERLHPAERYVFVDDKTRLLAAFKQVWGERVITVFPRQGHYAAEPMPPDRPAPDVTVERIAELLDWSPSG